MPYKLQVPADTRTPKTTSGGGYPQKDCTNYKRQRIPLPEVQADTLEKKPQGASAGGYP